mmetsp:Transcript_16494/g.24396  ORF Transcript_16494/g.24396 Transcript_16494/m.24396 type:complete len:136 (+) Transcript_16494:101-508(+)
MTSECAYDERALCLYLGVTDVPKGGLQRDQEADAPSTSVPCPQPAYPAPHPQHQIPFQSQDEESPLKAVHWNMQVKSVALEKSQEDTPSLLKDKHPSNIQLKFVAFETSHPDKSSSNRRSLQFLFASKTCEKSVI